MKLIVQLPNGKYVKDWGYSQGYFSMGETDKPAEAIAVTKDQFNTHFRTDYEEYGEITKLAGSKLMRAEIKVVLTDVTPAMPQKERYPRGWHPDDDKAG